MAALKTRRMYLPERTVLTVHRCSDDHPGLAHYQEIPSPSTQERKKPLRKKKNQTQSISLFYFLEGNKTEIMLNAHSFPTTIGSLGKARSNRSRQRIFQPSN